MGTVGSFHDTGWIDARAGRALPLVLLSLAALPLVQPCAWGAPPEEPSEQARKILNEGGYQQELPELGADGLRQDDGNRAAGDQQQQLEETDDAGDGFGLAMIGGLLDLVMWVGILVACVGAIYLLVRVLRQDVPVESEEPEPIDEAEAVSEQTIDRSGMQETLADADELAQEGRYTDAIRRMFMDATERIERDLDVSMSKSDTNHEYLERITGSGDLRALCRELVTAVDRFYYGGKPCEESDYRRCRTVWKKVQSRSAS